LLLPGFQDPYKSVLLQYHCRAVDKSTACPSLAATTTALSKWDSQKQRSLKMLFLLVAQARLNESDLQFLSRQGHSCSIRVRYNAIHFYLGRRHRLKRHGGRAAAIKDMSYLIRAAPHWDVAHLFLASTPPYTHG
jgi:hypothetical protein